MRSPVAVFFLAAFAVIAVLVAVAALWIAHLRAGPRLDGFSGGPMVAIVPFGTLVLALVWLLARYTIGRRIAWRVPAVLAASAGLAIVVTVVNCGPVACYAPGTGRLMGWFMLGGTTTAALAHHLVVRRFGRGQNGRTQL